MSRGRPQKLTIDIREQIIEILDRQKSDNRPMMKAPAMRKHLLRMYREDLRKKGIPDNEIQSMVDSYDKKILPGESSIQKFIASLQTVKGLDKPFSLGELINSPIPPETLPMVLRVWAKRLEEAEPDKDGFSHKMTFTIRHALWVSRFSRLFDDPEAIWGYAFWYSVRERAYEAIGKTPDTIDLDEELLKNFKPKPTKERKKGGKQS